MLGRRGILRPRSEAERHDLAHNMTVTPWGLGGVAEVVQACLRMGYGMQSFQPAAHVGNRERWREDFHRVSLDSSGVRSSAARAPGCRGGTCRWAMSVATAPGTACSPVGAGFSGRPRGLTRENAGLARLLPLHEVRT